MRYFLSTLVILMSLQAVTASAQDFDKGARAYNRGDYAAALREFLTLAEQGNVHSQYNLGQMYRKGQGVSQDFAKAANFYRLAAEQNFAQAQTALGLIYTKGLSVPQDFAEAVKWFRRAAEQGEVNAQNNLGNRYAKGQGVPQDLTEAVKWWRKAAAQGHTAAQRSLASVQERQNSPGATRVQNSASGTSGAASFGTGVEVSQNFEKGRSAARAGNYAAAIKEWRPLAESGHVRAQFNLGALYEGGLGVQKNMPAAANWYSRAADKGHARAQYNLGIMYLEGRGVTRDDTKAADLLRKAAEQKHGKAQYNLAVLYQSGRGVPKDDAQARLWFNRAKKNRAESPNVAQSIPKQTKSNRAITGLAGQRSPSIKPGVRKFNNWRVTIKTDEFENKFKPEVEARIFSTKGRYIGDVKVWLFSVSNGRFRRAHWSMYVRGLDPTWPACDYEYTKYRIDNADSRYFPTSGYACPLMIVNNKLLQSLVEGNTIRFSASDKIGVINLSGFSEAMNYAIRAANK